MCFVQMIKVATRQLVGWVGEGNQLQEEEEEKGIHMLEAHISLSLPINTELRKNIQPWLKPNFNPF